MTVLTATIVDVTIVSALALGVAAVLRRRSAALRHMVLAAAIVAAALAPVLELLLPELPVVRWGTGSATVSSEASFTSGDATASTDAVAAPVSEAPVPWTAILIGIWVCGALVTSGGVLVGFLRLVRLRARCTTVRTGRWREMADELSRSSALRRRVEILQSRDRSLLVSCGVLRPKIILPDGAAEWTDARLLSVLAHELAHVRRFDGVVHLTGEVVRIVHWFNPLVWLACGRMRVESEHACDDAVLSGGVDATEYATDLLGVARHAVGAHHTWVAAPAVAHPSTLERRIAAVLSHRRNRKPLTSRAWVVVALVAGMVIVPLAAASVAPLQDSGVATVSHAGDVALFPAPVKPTPAAPVRRSTAPRVASAPAAAQLPGAIAGTMMDQTGGALPGVRVTLTDTTSGQQWVAVTTPEGRFAFRDVQPSRYEMVASLPGFATVTNILVLESGGSVQRTIALPIGVFVESINMSCGEPNASASPRSRQHAGRPQTAEAAFARLGQIWTRARQALVPVLLAQQAVPVRIGGNIAAPVKIQDVKPVCPRPPTENTTVRLVARIGVDGYLNDLRPISTGTAAPPVEFIESAFDAVRQWRYTPARLNGQPFDVTVTITAVYQGR